MPRGESYGTERIDRIDETTGLMVRQVTSFPTPSLHLHNETPTITPDGERMLFVTMRAPVRKAPWDAITCLSDGSDMVKLSSDAETGVSNLCMTMDGKHALYMEGATAHRTSLGDATDEEIGHVDGGSHRDYYRGCRSHCGRYYFSTIKLGEDVALVRWHLETGKHDIVARATAAGHPKANPGGPEMRFGLKHRQPDGSMKGEGLWLHSETLERIEVKLPETDVKNAHAMWLGATGNWVCTLKPPGRGVGLLDRKNDRFEMLAEGQYFWHPGASRDGAWVVADTNWPDEGLWLINVRTKRRKRLCFAGASQGHPQYTHLHANLNDDGSMAVFSSDRTNVTQVYVVPIPEDFRAKLSAD